MSEVPADLSIFARNRSYQSAAITELTATRYVLNERGKPSWRHPHSPFVVP